MLFVWLRLYDATARPDVTAIKAPRLGRSGWFAGTQAAEHSGVLEADGTGRGLDGGAVADQVLGSL